MKQIIFNNTIYPVIDETATHYICPPYNSNEGYYYIDKTRANKLITPL